MKFNVDLIYPIGSIYQSTSTISPEVLFGGTWKQIAQGRTLVGVDTSDDDFGTVRKTGGEKTHTLTVSEMPKHSHQLRDGTVSSGSSVYADRSTGNFSASYTNSTGGSQAHNNLQPYYCVYIWERIS